MRSTLEEQHSSLINPINIDDEEKNRLWTGWPDNLEKNRPIFSKVAKTAAKENSAKIQNTFLNSSFRWKCNKGTAIFWLFYQWAYKK
jgi:hypothetical protein